MNKLLNYFRQIGVKHQLNFSSQEILLNCILGLDGIHRKVLIVAQEQDYYTSSIIDLDQVKNCTVKKLYGSIKVGQLRKRRLEEYLQKIVLHFELKKGQPVEVEFYHHVNNHVYQVLELEQKAKYWEAILSKMQSPEKNIA